MFREKQKNQYFFGKKKQSLQGRDYDLEYREPTYFGGLLLWMYVGEELRTIYLIDVCFGCYLDWDRLRVTLTFTDMNQIDETYDGPEFKMASFTACRLYNAPELRDLVATSKKEMYHLIHTEWDGPAGWVFLTFGKIWTVSFPKFTDDTIIDAIIQTEGVAQLIGDVVDAKKTDEELMAFVQEKNLTKHLWFVDVDLRDWDTMIEKFMT